MRKLIPMLTVSLLLTAGAAWAQNAGTVVAPVTTPQATGTTVQGTSTATPQAAPAETKGAKPDEKKPEMKDQKK